jgi:hypothetical protein
MCYDIDKKTQLVSGIYIYGQCCVPDARTCQEYCRCVNATTKTGRQEIWNETVCSFQYSMKGYAPDNEEG